MIVPVNKAGSSQLEFSMLDRGGKDSLNIQFFHQGEGVCGQVLLESPNVTNSHVPFAVVN